MTATDWYEAVGVRFEFRIARTSVRLEAEPMYLPMDTAIRVLKGRLKRTAIETTIRADGLLLDAIKWGKRAPGLEVDEDAALTLMDTRVRWLIMLCDQGDYRREQAEINLYPMTLAEMCKLATQDKI